MKLYDLLRVLFVEDDNYKIILRTFKLDFFDREITREELAENKHYLDYSVIEIKNDISGLLIIIDGGKMF